MAPILEKRLESESILTASFEACRDHLVLTELLAQ